MQKLRTLLLASLTCVLCWLPLVPARPQAPSIPGYSIPGTGGNSQVFLPVSAFKYVNITGTTAVVVKSGAGVLHNITINTPAAGTITIFDNTSASGTKIGTITVGASSVPVTLQDDVVFQNGLTIVASVANDITVSYQ
jgi:hypothetical protein